ncbi:MAG: hypothetical protein PVJ53_15075 [Desulfobacterales bacterium]|jgi:hypothetical protein
MSDGISIIAAYERDQARLAEGTAFIADDDTMYLGLPGFKYDITFYFDVAEGQKMHGSGEGLR